MFLCEQRPPLPRSILPHSRQHCFQGHIDYKIPSKYAKIFCSMGYRFFILFFVQNRFYTQRFCVARLLGVYIAEAPFWNVGRETISSGCWTSRFYSVHPGKIHYSNIIRVRSFPSKFFPVHYSPIVYCGSCAGQSSILPAQKHTTKYLVFFSLSNARKVRCM